MYSRKELPVFYFLFYYSLLFSQGTWVQKASVFSTPRAGVVGFSIGSKGYFVTGWIWSPSEIYYSDYWEWDQSTNIWTQKANFPGNARGDAVGFSIGNKGYVGTGLSGNYPTNTYYNDFWEWDQGTNTWTPKANFPGAPRAFAVGFSIGLNGYIGIGWANTGPSTQDFWEWNQTTNSWTRKADFGPGGERRFAIGFSLAGKGYVGGGDYPSDYYDFWEFDPGLNTWTQKADIPGGWRERAACFAINKKGYVGTGYNKGYIRVLNDFWEWDQPTNTWTQKASYPHVVSDIDHACFSIGCHGYFGCGTTDPNYPSYYNDFWEYTPEYVVPVVAAISGNSTICIGSSTSLTASGGIYYSWSTGETNNTIAISPTSTTNYSVVVATDCASTIAVKTISVITASTASFAYQYDPCKDKCIVFADQSINALAWHWDYGDGATSNIKNECHNYSDSSTYNVSLIINRFTNCADTFSLPVPFVRHDTSAFVYIPNAFSPNSDGSNDLLQFFRKDAYCLKEFELAIYDRWGEKVFETTNINDTWDGTINGEPVNSSVLAYYCKTVTAAGLQQMRKGSIAVVR